MPRRRRWDWARWGVHLKARRGGRRWTQRDLAARVGVTRNTITRLEAGTRRPSVELLDRLATAFDLSYEDVLKGAWR